MSDFECPNVHTHTQFLVDYIFSTFSTIISHPATPTILTQCLVTCGKGMRHRQVSCSMGAGEEKLSEHFCDPSSKPPAVGSCKLPECASWQVGVWGAVSPADTRTCTHTHSHSYDIDTRAR